MFVSDLAVQQFRNYRELNLAFTSPVNVITGMNGSGKTNILEALYVLSNVRSFRSYNDSVLINWNADYFFCKSSINDDSDERIFSVGYTRSPQKKKKLMINGQEITSSTEYYGSFLTVIISPDDINYLSGNPEIRRRYFDSVISKTDSDYMSALSSYRHILSSRNALLKNIQKKKSMEDELDVWDHLLFEKAEMIVTARSQFIKNYSPVFNSYYATISENHENCDVVYSVEEVQAGNLLEKLKQSRLRDIQMGFTTQGPHRDDYLFKNQEGKPFALYASQGQMRTSSVALKLAEKDIIEQKKQGKPVILVDDIFSELDEKRKSHLLTALRGDNQVFFTMVEPDYKSLNNFSMWDHFVVDDTAGVQKIEVQH